MLLHTKLSCDRVEVGPPVNSYRENEMLFLIKLMVPWLLALAFPPVLGQTLLDAGEVKATQVVVSVYVGYAVFLMVAALMVVLAKLPLPRVFCWMLVIHALVSWLMAMPVTFFAGALIGILVLYGLICTSSRLIINAQTKEV